MRNSELLGFNNDNHPKRNISVFNLLSVRTYYSDKLKHKDSNHPRTPLGWLRKSELPELKHDNHPKKNLHYETKVIRKPKVRIAAANASIQ